METPPIGNKEQEIRNTFSAIENFFIYMHLHEAKEMLAEVKEQLFHKNYPHLPHTVPYDNTVYFFEKLEELLSAVHLLYRRNS
jgi:hypothetical protein